MVSRSAILGALRTVRNRTVAIEPRKFGFEVFAIGAAASLLLISCAQVDVAEETAPQSTEPSQNANVQLVNGSSVSTTKVQTPYGEMNLGQVLVVDGVPLYVSATGLLPVAQESQAQVFASNPIELKGADGSQLASALDSQRFSQSVEHASGAKPPLPGEKAATPRIQPVAEPVQSAKPVKKSVPAKPSSGKEPQYVMLAFDGSRSLDMWRDTRAFARQQGIEFTYFISGVYFLNKTNKTKYKGPGFKRGVSHIGWAKTASEVGERLKQVNAAFNEGHEIASHANGHFNGSKWSHKQWSSELSQFRSIMRNAYVNNGLSEPSFWRSRVNNEMFKGFRAPLLGVSKGMWPALRDFGYTYDTSLTAPQSYWPRKKNGVYNFPLGHVTTARSRKRTLSMDYNFYVVQSKARPMPSRSAEFEQEMFETYMNYFNNNYKGNRAPVHIGHHFSLWNKGAYWRAMKRFAKAVCGKKDVRCATYGELEAYLKTRNSNLASR